MAPQLCPFYVPGKLSFSSLVLFWDFSAFGVCKTPSGEKENSNWSNSYSFPTRSDRDLLFLSSGWYARRHFLGTGTNGPPPYARLRRNTVDCALCSLGQYSSIFHYCFGIFVHRKFRFFIDFVGFVGRNPPRYPSDGLGRSFGIMFSPKFQNPTMLVNHFHVFCNKK